MPDFSDHFEQLTGYPPLQWQERLWKQFPNSDNLNLPSVIDLPTGLGKTMIMAIWLIARAMRPATVPTRLIYVVDRRTVVDQATDLAEEFAYLLSNDAKDRFGHVLKRKPKLAERRADLAKLRAALKSDLAVSPLRGQLADNREWSADPTRPAIIIGTVDLIGSALLFSGYRSSYKRRPLEAGLLGMDSLLVLDEAHLSRPFEKLLNSIESLQKNTSRHGTVPQVKPLRVIRMSATTANTGQGQFKLEEDDLDDETKKRISAQKTLSITTLQENDKLTDKLADAAIDLARDSNLKGQRIVVFVRTPDDATKIAERIRKKDSTKKNSGPDTQSVEVLTGTMRGLERDELVEKPVLKRFLGGDKKADLTGASPAGGSELDRDKCIEESGLTLFPDADKIPREEMHDQPVFLVSTSAGEVGMDLNADHMVCDATTIDSLIQRLGRVNRRGNGEAQVRLFYKPPKQSKENEPKGLDLAIKNTIQLLNGVTDVSPNNIAALKDGQWKDSYANACSPPVPTVELTDILLDNWAMTSIVQPMPGRPEVGPWLRGIDDDLPQTTIAWRAELDLPGFANLEIEDVEEWFDTHRILTHETLSDRSDRVTKVLVERWEQLQEKLQPEELKQLKQSAVVVDRAGLRVMTVENFMKWITDRNGKAVPGPIQYAELILPAAFGGIERQVGLLDAEAPDVPKDETQKPAEEQKTARRQRAVAPDVADVRGRYRELITTNEDGETETKPLIPNTARPSGAARFTLTLQADDEKTIRLVSYVPRTERPEVGSQPQTLNAHVAAVHQKLDTILNRLSLPDEIKTAARLAAQYHDHGKARDRWQRLLIFQGDFKPNEPMAKSGGEMKRDPRGYRHEFGSLREFIAAFTAQNLRDQAGNPITPEVCDLAMHLIATHHGRGRPHFPRGAFDPDAEDQSDEIHTESIRRFARLQRKYGWWGLAWLENLLRCADQLASADPQNGNHPAEGAAQ